MSYVLFLLLGLFWSASFIFIKITVLVLPPILSALLRVVVAQITFSLFFVVMRHRLQVPFASIWRLWIIGIFLQGIPFLLLFIGECYVAPALASIINGTVAIWVLCFSILIFRDYSQVTLPKLSGLALGVLGVLFIFIPMVQAGTHTKAIGVLAITGMAMSYGIGALLNQHFCKCKYKVGIQASLWHQHWGSLMFLLTATLLFEPHINLGPLFHNPHVLLALLYLGVCSTAVAWFIYCYLIENWGAVRASSVLYIVPILTIIWDILFLHLVPTLNEIYGIIIILLGVALIQFTKKRIKPKI